MSATHDNLLERTGEYIDRYIQISRDSTIVVAVSGGMDSVCLLSVLSELACQQQRRYKLVVAHLDHCLRGDISEADGEFVKAMAKQLHLPCHIERIDVQAMAEPNEGIEQACRRVRYDFLSRVATMANSKMIVVAHHADDNVETVLFNLFRGTHLRGLGGMKPSRDLGVNQIRLARPFLDISCDDLELHCRMRHITWREDKSNDDTRFTRNFIRRDLLPLLRGRLNPDINGAILRISRASREADDFIGEIARETFLSCVTESGDTFCSLDAASLASAKPIIRRYVFRLVLESIGASMQAISAKHYSDISSLVDCKVARVITLPRKLTVRYERGMIAFDIVADASAEEEIQLSISGASCLSDGRAITCCVTPATAGDISTARTARDGTEMIDADKITSPLTCRIRRDGDMFIPLGCSGKQSVSDFLTNSKLSARARKAVRCICDTDGIIYLAPLRIADRVKITASTKNILRIDLG